MASLACLVFTPSTLNTAGDTVDTPNGAAMYRTPTPLPLNISAPGDTTPVGPQRWPLKL